MARYAGLEIDRDTLRLAIFDGSPKSYSLVDFIEEDISAESEEERREIIDEVLSEITSTKENRGIEFVSCLDARSATLREITVPYTREDIIEKTIRFEAESYLHAHAIDDVIIEFLKCNEIDDSSRLILCAMQKSHILRHLEDLKKPDVDPVTIELDATALATSFQNTPLYNGEQNVLLIELQPDYSRLVFLEKDRIAKIRSFWSRRAAQERPDRLLGGSDGDAGAGSPPPLSSTGNGGGSSLGPNGTSDGDAAVAAKANEAVAKGDIETRFEEIERSLMELDRIEEGDADEVPIAIVNDDEYLRLSGSPSGRASAGAAQETSVASEATGAATAIAPPAVGDPLDRLFLEIERTFAGYVLNNPIDLVVVTGACAEELNAVPRIAERFEVDAVPFDMSDSFEITWTGDRAALATRGTVACGLALRALGKGATSFDLRKDEFVFERRFEKLMPSLTLLGLVCCVITLLWSVMLYHKSVRLNQEIAILRQNQRDACQRFFGEEPDFVDAAAPGAIKTEAFKRLQQLKGGGSGKGGRSTRGSRKIKQFLSPLEVMNDITQAVAEVRPAVFPKWESFDLNLEISDRVARSKVKLAVTDQDENRRIVTQVKTRSKLFEASGSYQAGSKSNQLTLDLELKKTILNRNKQ